jgi:hypothetical protein
MSAELIGALAGAGVGLSGYLALRAIASKVEAEEGEAGRRKAAILRMVGIADVVLMTLIGAYVGPLALGG